MPFRQSVQSEIVVFADPDVSQTILPATRNSTYAALQNELPSYPAVIINHASLIMQI